MPRADLTEWQTGTGLMLSAPQFPCRTPVARLVSPHPYPRQTVERPLARTGQTAGGGKKQKKTTAGQRLRRDAGGHPTSGPPAVFALGSGHTSSRGLPGCGTQMLNAAPYHEGTRPQSNKVRPKGSSVTLPLAPFTKNKWTLRKSPRGAPEGQRGCRVVSGVTGG